MRIRRLHADRPEYVQPGGEPRPRGADRAGRAPVPAPVDPRALAGHPRARPPIDEPLRQAVAAARARKPDVVFEVAAIVAPEADLVANPAANVARAIAAQGVPATRIRLSARPEPGADGSEVRVYVR